MVQKFKPRSKVAAIQTLADRKFYRKKPIKYLFEFMEESSMHGLNHASFKNLHMMERVFWMLAFVASIFVCGVLLKNLYGNFINAPVIVSYDGDLKSVKHVRRVIIQS